MSVTTGTRSSLQSFPRDSGRTAVVPHSEYLAAEQEEGRLIAEAEYRDNCRAAFRNIARRLSGRDVPLFDGFSRMSDWRRRLLLR